MHEIYVEAVIENIPLVLDFLNDKLRNYSEKDLNNFGIVVDEIFSNIAQYAYTPKVGGVTVRLSLGEWIELEFEDSGVAYDPMTAEKPDSTLPVESRKIGGLGIFIVKNIMDEVLYSREGEKNILKLRYRPKGKSGEKST